MPVLDLLNWPVTEGVESEESEDQDPRTVAQLRVELADAQRELRRLRARLDHVEEENDRLARQLERHQRASPTPGRAAAGHGDTGDADVDAGEPSLPLATIKRG